MKDGKEESMGIGSKLWTVIWICIKSISYNSLCWKGLESIILQDQETYLAPTYLSLNVTLLKGTGAFGRNGKCQDWGREVKRWTWNIFFCQTVKKYSTKQIIGHIKRTQESTLQNRRLKKKQNKQNCQVYPKQSKSEKLSQSRRN